MAKFILLFLLIYLLLPGCEKSEKLDIPTNYPTTYAKLSTGSLTQMRSSFALENKYMTSSLNDFGFCDYFGDPLNVGTPPQSELITKSEATEIAKNFVAANSSCTGVVNPAELIFASISTSTGFGGSVAWHFKTANQMTDTIEVLNSMILIHLTNGVVTSCYGNWFPEIIIPSKFNLSQTKAKESLEGKSVSHYNIAGQQYTVKISKTELDQSTIRLKILPVENADKIELHVCWQINIPGPVYYIIYVDAITGTIVGQEPTIIS